MLITFLYKKNEFNYVSDIKENVKEFLNKTNYRNEIKFAS